MAKLIIGVGGTGKSVSLVFLKLARFFDMQSDVLIIDMPFQRERGIDDQLNQEGVEQSDFITPWAGGAIALGGATFARVIGLAQGDIAQPVANALFASDELGTLVEDGMNCRPIVGATIAMRKFWRSQQDAQLDNLQQRIGQYNDVFLVAGITGGTGAGVTPSLARWLTEVCRKRVHGVLLLPYADLGAGAGTGPNNAAQDANAYASLSYLDQLSSNGTNIFQDYLVIGRPENVEAASGTITADHPLHLLAATYIVYYDEFLRRNPQQVAGPFYLEVKASGLRESEIRSERGLSLAHGIYSHLWYQDVLRTLAGQKPDQSWDIMAPPFVASLLAWPVLRESVRDIAASGGYGTRGRVWNIIRNHFLEEAESIRRRIEHFEAITSRDIQHAVYNISWERLRQEAGATVGRARRAAKRVGKPNIDRVVDTQDSAIAAASTIGTRVKQELSPLSMSIARRGEQQAPIQGSSTVFLPPGVHNPAGPPSIERRPLTNLTALIQQYQGIGEAVNMPDPQARRYQFAKQLDDALDRYSHHATPNKASWDADDALAQFTALLEGVIFGKLQISLYDLSEYGFISSYERRTLGVLIDRNGNVSGGTDPETLFFPAPESWRAQGGSLRQLSDENGVYRDANAGRLARVLMRNFRDSFGTGPERPIWLRAIDEYLRVYTPPTQVDEIALKAGWKQVGPTYLRMPNRSISEKYLPVYDSNFADLAASALGSSYFLHDSSIRLETNSQEIGSINYPQDIRAGLTQKLMGAGCIHLTGAANQLLGTFSKVNYSELYQKCQSLINGVNPSLDSILADPFNYPDIVRLPFQQDGFVAEYLLQGNLENHRFSQRFLDMMRGRGIGAAPAPAPGERIPHMVKNGDHYFVDEGGLIYVERFQGKHVKDLTLLGQALWMIFVGEAIRVQNEDKFVDAGGRVILELVGKRFVTGAYLEQPDEVMRAADLRALVSYKDRSNISPLFKESVTIWLSHFDLNPSPAQSVRRTIEIGERSWGQP
jgi:hypothetical protein